MKKVLITGSNGLLGQKLVHLLTKNPAYYTFATSRGANRINGDFQNFEYHSLDITNREAVLQAISALKPHYVINTAAMTNVDQCESEQELCRAMNVDAVSYLVEACALNDAFLLHLSTDFIFDGEAGPYDEEAMGNPLSFYGESKLDAERLVIKSNIRWAIARTVLVYGIAQDMSRSNIVLWVKNSLENGKVINVVDDQWRTPTLAEDLARGCELIIANNATGIYNISGKEMLTPYDMAIKTADFFRLDKSLINRTDSTKFTQPAKRPLKTGFIITKAQQDLIYRPHTFEEGIRLMVRQLSGEVPV
jgi:dTDP-4-dehydrorhamnose reductase